MTESVDEKIARNIARKLGVSPVAPSQPLQPSLPSGDGEVDLVTLTLDELHDLVYLSASAINQTSTRLSKSHAQELASQTAMLARTRATRHDGHHRGSDPRA